eukprot:CAMPEP_0174740976 /NCGR_PEP_ID=MMETSP1094-20130205/74995_1 /TAXON_ID=156173 /ORGANISM="Chrysochromulina brevifilum, Strain UTEX LB 985" /LENGTH=194 /DNA_ID=CAMNT_0015944789 /DNA_START=174 /DNA_END=758 /DNA_ORIENTATION=+
MHRWRAHTYPLHAAAGRPAAAIAARPRAIGALPPFVACANGLFACPVTRAWEACDRGRRTRWPLAPRTNVAGGAPARAIVAKTAARAALAAGTQRAIGPRATLEARAQGVGEADAATRAAVGAAARCTIGPGVPRGTGAGAVGQADAALMAVIRAKSDVAPCPRPPWPAATSAIVAQAMGTTAVLTEASLARHT